MKKESFKKLIIFPLLLLISLASAQQSPQEKLKSVFNPQSNKVLVAAHRGDWRNAPENSVQGLKNAIGMGVDIVELDLKKTKDGVLIVMHDKTIDRTTTGKGYPQNFVLDSLKKLFLRKGNGVPSNHRIPTFEEFLIAAKDKVIIDVDKGYEYFDDVVKMLKKHDMTKQAIINIDDNTYYNSIVTRFGAIDTSVIIMPIINYTKPNAGKIIASYFGYPNTIFQPVFKSDTLSLIAKMDLLKHQKFGLWLNSLWPSLNGGHDDDKAVEENNPDETWGWLLKKGANIIQTDRPKELLNYLKEKKLHQ
ncbi:glycerophosphoryl diester phosphodiesterase [Mucilaginibacter gracilis]|uniref:Glycerophosphoryl diester phosphodiesterase n=1 Tax=Mucilaginibacter gracilis TaxID=423350 RepID=A0A495J5X0_9SPHI|nr:glycerophosphodiester phosphodiesterase family protein [Mucilaginibacter gracilis]RKR84022.1 glycerophosphoryl diester phosphodiesterase [Mucilaginibacter gracilis]